MISKSGLASALDFFHECDYIRVTQYGGANGVMSLTFETSVLLLGPILISS